jgi:hypothetical protein
MANTRAVLIGSDRTRDKEAHRLGSVSSAATVATWRTFVRSHIRADGSGYVLVIRDGKAIHSYEFGTENGEGS